MEIPIAPARLPSTVAAREYRSDRLSVSAPLASASPSDVACGIGTLCATAAVLDISKLPMPKSTLNNSWPRSSKAMSSTARPTANAKRSFLPGYTSARPRAARHRAATGFMVTKPEPQLDSIGNPTPQPMSAVLAIVTATKPATWLACFLSKLLPVSPTNAVTWAPHGQKPVASRRSRKPVVETCPAAPYLGLGHHQILIREHTPR